MTKHDLAWSPLMVTPVRTNYVNIGGCHYTRWRDTKESGVLFDSTIILDDHVAALCKSTNSNFIGKIRKHLDTPTAEKMINCSITSCLDYCNNPPFGTKTHNITQLQLCQNNVARMLSLHHNFDHIISILKVPRWLPVEQKIECKVLLLTYKALNGNSLA